MVKLRDGFDLIKLAAINRDLPKKQYHLSKVPLKN